MDNTPVSSAKRMSSAERVRTAVSGGIPDRVPSFPKIFIDLAARITGKETVSIVGDPMAILSTLVEAGKEVQADAVRLFHFPKRIIKEKEGIVYETDADGNAIGSVDMDGGLMTHLFDPGLVDLTNPRWIAFLHYYAADQPFVRDLDDAKKIAVPDKSFYIDYGCKERQDMAIHAAGDLALVGDCSSPTMAFLATMRGMNNALFDLYDDPMLVQTVMDAGVRISAERGKFLIDSGIRILRINDSVGNMSVISPSQWREFVKPHFKDLCTELHRYNPEVKLYCHICGNTLPIAEDLVETGLDCIAPLDPLGGFTATQMRERVGDSVALMGGVNTMSFVQHTAKEIETEVATCIRGAGRKGGYIIGSGCAVPRAASLENLLALKSGCERYGTYEDGELKY
jgi:uroporphyrinogen-III decarboxylase